MGDVSSNSLIVGCLNASHPPATFRDHLPASDSTGYSCRMGRLTPPSLFPPFQLRPRLPWHPRHVHRYREWSRTPGSRVLQASAEVEGRRKAERADRRKEGRGWAA